MDTHIDEVLPVANQQVPENPSLVQVPQADHVLHSMDGGGVHRFDVAGILWGNPVLLGKEQGHRKVRQMRDHLDERQKQPTPKRRTRQKNIHKRSSAHVPQLLFLGQDSDGFQIFVTEEGKHLFIGVLLEQQEIGDTSHPGRSSPRATWSSSTSGEFLANSKFTFPFTNAFSHQWLTFWHKIMLNREKMI